MAYRMYGALIVPLSVAVQLLGSKRQLRPIGAKQHPAQALRRRIRFHVPLSSGITGAAIRSVLPATGRYSRPVIL